MPSISADQLRDWATLNHRWDVGTLNSHTEVRNGTRYHTQWFSAIHQSTNECRRYRVWLNEGLSPPYRKQQGWELFDTTGYAVDREIRYSRRNNDDYLH